MQLHLPKDLMQLGSKSLSTSLMGHPNLHLRQGLRLLRSPKDLRLVLIFQLDHCHPNLRQKLLLFKQE